MTDEEIRQARYIIASCHRWLAWMSEEMEEGRIVEARWDMTSGETRPPYTTHMNIAYDRIPGSEVGE